MKQGSKQMKGSDKGDVPIGWIANGFMIGWGMRRNNIFEGFKDFLNGKRGGAHIDQEIMKGDCPIGLKTKGWRRNKV